LESLRAKYAHLQSSYVNLANLHSSIVDQHKKEMYAKDKDYYDRLCELEDVTKESMKQFVGVAQELVHRTKEAEIRINKMEQIRLDWYKGPTNGILSIQCETFRHVHKGQIYDVG
jgi:hypothetical protein